jgi:hypothetical protein
MTKEEWDELFNCFEGSGLTQKAFCIARGLEHKHFLYRWNARRRLKKKTKQSSSGFEPISVISKPLTLVEQTLSIYLPNKIHCEVRLPSNELLRWIKELSNVNS